MRKIDLIYGGVMLKTELINRVNELKRKLELQSLDSYIVTDEYDIWYFTNLTYKPEERPFFLIISQQDNPVLIVPKLEESHVNKSVLDCEIITYWDYPSPLNENWYDVFNQFIKKYDRVGIENNVKTNIFQHIHVKELVPSQFVSEQRKVKSDFEVKEIKRSAHVSSEAMKTIFKSIYKGASVIEPFALSRQIQTNLIRSKQFDPITTSLLTAVWPAPISSMPHSVPNLDDRLGSGPNVAMAYFRINGYSSECERTFFLEKPTSEEEELFNHMMIAREKSLNLLKPGIKVSDVDSEARNYLIKNSFKNNLLHRTGHGVGVQNHEAPFLAEGSDDVLKENMIITIEPGIYIDQVGGYRHSDTILITKDGFEILTDAPQELSELIIKKPNRLAKLKGKIMKRALKIDK